MPIFCPKPALQCYRVPSKILNVHCLCVRLMLSNQKQKIQQPVSSTYYCTPNCWIYPLTITDHKNNQVEFCMLYWTQTKQSLSKVCNHKTSLWLFLLLYHRSECVIRNKRSESICPHAISCLESQIVKVEVIVILVLLWHFTNCVT